MLEKFARPIAALLCATVLLAVVLYPHFMRARTGGGPPPQKAAVNRRVATAYQYYQDGRRAWSQKDFRTAEGAFRKSLQVDSESPLVWLALADLLREEQRIDEALEAYRQVFDAHPDWTSPMRAFWDPKDAPDAEALMRYALLCKHFGRNGEARSAFRGVIESVKSKQVYIQFVSDQIEAQELEAAAHIALGISRNQRHMNEEAQKAYREAIHLQPNQPLSLFYLGLGLERLHRYQQAEAAYRKALLHAEGDMKVAAQHALGRVSAAQTIVQKVKPSSLR